MLNKNDPLVGAIQDVMRKNQAERDAVKAVNEKFGVHDRRVLPREKQGEWDAAYKSVLTEGLHPNQQKLDVHEPEKDELTKHDFKMLRSKKKSMEEENAPKTDPYAEGQASSISTVPQPKKEVTPSDQSALKKKIMSIKEAKSNAYAIGMAAVKKSTGDEPPMEKKNITKAHKIAKKILAKKKMNEGFNNRYDSSVTAPVEGQVVAEAAKARSDYGLGAAAAPKDAAAARAKIDTAMEPVVNVSKALVPGATAVDKLAQGDYKGAAVDAGISLAGGALVGGALKAGKAVYNAVKGTTKAATGAEKVAAGTTKALPTSAPANPVSQAAREPAASATTKGSTAVDNFISKAKSTPVTPAAREGGSAASTAAANASKYNKPGTVGGRFSDKLAQARKGSENYGPSKGGVAVRKTTEPATVTRPGVPAVAKKPGVPAVANRPGVPAAANRPGLPARVGGSSGAKVAGRTSNLKDIGTKALVAAGVGGAMYGLSNKNQPDSTQAGTPPAGGGGGSTTAKTQPAVKPGTQQAAKNKVVQKVATNTRSRLQSRNQRDDTIGAGGRSTKGPGGVTSGTKTGKIITNRPAVVKKNPVGMGKVK
jgi:hypothetical protein